MNPFFIIGAPRSGTTILRDCFRRCPDLYSPEETHFFRWSCPFRGNEYRSIYNNNNILKKHRKLDRIDEKEFGRLVDSSLTRKELTSRYCQLAAEKEGKQLWFEKTPQNVYGLPLLAEQYPESRIVHIVRNPYSVVKSLMVGKVLRVDDIVGASSYWYESVAIINVMKPYLQNRLFEIKYEDFVNDPQRIFKRLCKSLGIVVQDVDLASVKPRKGKEHDCFSGEQRQIIREICGAYMDLYEYT